MMLTSPVAWLISFRTLRMLEFVQTTAQHLEFAVFYGYFPVPINVMFVRGDQCPEYQARGYVVLTSLYRHLCKHKLIRLAYSQ